jgi:murein tripeptide amidase MpaA
MKKILPIIICFLVISSGLSIASEKKDNISNVPDQQIITSCLVKIESNNAQNIASMLFENGYDVLRNSITESNFELIVNPYEFNLLKNQGYNPILIDKGRPFYDIQQERFNQAFDVPPGYLDLSEIIEQMNSTESEYPEICKVYDITEEYDVSPTYEGRHIYAMKISDNVEEDEDEPNFLMVSCHHAREIITPVIALYSIEQLTSNYGADPSITSAVDDYEIWISPVWNPDGYEYCYYVDNWWRKNRFPPDGIDLNRNYPFGWNSGCSGSTDPYSETYKGSSPASEVETLTMMEFTNDRHFAKVIDYHSYGSEVLYGYACHSHPFNSFLQAEAINIANEAGYYGSIRSPSAEGEHYEWQLAFNGSYAFLMETHVEFQPSYASAEDEAEQVWPSTMYMLERPITISGHVTDSITDAPIKAEITLEDISFQNDEFFFSEPDYGRYHLFLPAGTYDIKFEAENYISDNFEITVTDNSAEILDVELERYNNPPFQPIIDGSEDCLQGENYRLMVQGSDPENDDLYFFVDWGDQTSGEWNGPFSVEEPALIDHIFSSPGQFNIKVKAKDVYEEEGPWSDSITVIVDENFAPIDPDITGTNRGSPNVDYEYNFMSVDPEGYMIYYFIDWGDGTYEEWIGPYYSAEKVDILHQWSEKARYTIKAKAKDEFGFESGWTTFNVNIPRSRDITRSILELFTDRLSKILRFFFIY